MASETRTTWISSITAVSTTVAATLLVGFLGTFKDLAAQAPLISAHMEDTNRKLVIIEEKQQQQGLILASLNKDYTSRDSMLVAMEKIEDKIRALQLQQAVIQSRLEGRVTR